MISRLLGFAVISLLFYSVAYSQNDTIRLKSGDQLVGEIKFFSEGVLTIETAYSDKDFKIEFNKVSELVIQRKCLIILTDDRRLFGNIKSKEPEKVVITLEDGKEEEYSLSDVIALQEVRDKFFQRFKAAIDVSYNFAKANKTAQFTVSGNLKYNSELWLFEAYVKSLSTHQEDADKTRRTEANIEFVRLLQKKLYLISEIPFLSNTEQALDARISPSVGIGKFIVSTNKLYLSVSAGFTLNIENYSDAALNKDSSEGFISLSLNIYDVEDFDLETDIKFYPSISENGRIRTDYNLSLKYDLPLDFYIKLGFSLNYDNKPAIAGNDVDYIFTSGIGWNFN